MIIYCLCYTNIKSTNTKTGDNTMTTKTESIKDMLQDYLKEKDCNHWVRRFARCYFDGSYDYSKLGLNRGSDFYARNSKDFKIANQCCVNSKASLKEMLRSKVIYYFTHFIALEYSCSYSHAQKCIINSMSKEELAELTEEIIADYIDIYSC